MSHARTHRTTRLDSTEKVAALLLAMGKSVADRLLKHFEEDDLRRLTATAAELRPLPVTQLEQLIEEFAGHFSQGADVIGSPDGAKNLLSGIMSPEKVQDMMADVLGRPKDSVWARVATLPENIILPYLLNEHPQVIALILDKIGSAAAATLIVKLPTDLRATIARRLVGIGTLTTVCARMVEGALERELLGTSGNGSTEPERRLSEIINKLEREEVEDLLAALATTRPAIAEKIRSKLFNFEDIVKLSQRARLILFEKVPTERVILALKETDDAFREVVLSSMGGRARRMVEQELKDAQPSPPKDIAAARRVISQTVVELVERGQIELNVEEQAQSAA